MNTIIKIVIANVITISLLGICYGVYSNYDQQNKLKVLDQIIQQDEQRKLDNIYTGFAIECYKGNPEIRGILSDMNIEILRNKTIEQYHNDITNRMNQIDYDSQNKIIARMLIKLEGAN
jgi:hypothetical protein